MVKTDQRLRVAFLAGTLGQGGAEKQLVYIVRALLQAQVDVRVYTLTRGEYYETALQQMGVQPVWVGRFASPLLRLVAFALALRGFRPHIVQSTHFFGNLYVTLIAHLYQVEAIGAIRNDPFFELDATGRWGKMLINLPPSLIANSYAARRNAELLNTGPEKIFVLPNVIDLPAFDAQMLQRETNTLEMRRPVVVAIARLAPAKRLERFIAALALAGRKTKLKGVIVGDGPERANLQSVAREQDLSPDNLVFLCRQDDIPALLGQADMLVLTSDHEGFPNVLLEAMAARLPVITTPAGDAGSVVQDGVTGYVVAFDDFEGMAEHIARLAQSSELRQRLGAAGRRRVEAHYGFEGLSSRLLRIYLDIAERQSNYRLLRVLEIV